MGKRLIAKALVKHSSIQAVVEKGTLVIVAGTTNGYVAQEVLASLGQEKRFSLDNFYRGVVTPPSKKSSSGKFGKGEFPGDVVIVDGKWQVGKTIFDVVDDLKTGDVILKGANAVNLCRKQAGVYIADPNGGTAGASIRAIVGRRVKLIVPVGLEKRVTGDINEIANKLNSPETQGPRMLVLPGEIFTELDALALLSGCQVSLLAGGGVGGAEGGVWLGAKGSEEQLATACEVIDSIVGEPLFGM